MKCMNVKSGTIQFWGEWFGRPLDNYHTAIETYWDGDNVLVIKFNQGEIVTIHSPINITSSEKEFSIEDALIIIFEWYYYGREHKPENLRRFEYKVINDNQILCTRMDIDTGTRITTEKLSKKGLLAMKIV